MYLPGPIRFAKCQVCSRCMIVHKNMTRTWQDNSNTSAVQLQSRVRTVSRHTNACESAECPRLGAIVSAGLRSRPPCTRTLLENGRTLGPPGPPCGLLYTVRSRLRAQLTHRANETIYIVSFALVCAFHGVSPRDRWLCVLPGWQMNVNVNVNVSFAPALGLVP